MRIITDRFKDWNISKKIAFAFSIITLLASVAGVLGVGGLLRTKNSDETLYNENTVALQYAGSVGLSFQQLQYDMLKLNAIDLKNADQRKPITDEMTALIVTINDKFDKIVCAINDPDTKMLIDDLTINWETYADAITEVIDSVKNGDNTYLNQTSSVTQIGSAVRDQLESLFQVLSDNAGYVSEDNASLSNTIIIIEIAIVTLLIIMALLLGSRLTNALGKPLKTLAGVAELLADGDTNADVLLTEKEHQLKFQKDEIGIFAAAFHKLIGNSQKQVETIQAIAEGDLTVKIELSSERDQVGKALVELSGSLSKLIGMISISSDQVASGANLISVSNASLSQGAVEQASSMQQLTSSLGKISTQTSENAQNAEEANNYVRKAKSNATIGNKQMQDMLSAMDEISDSSSNIEKIIKVIDDIAFQTNILALNAAVEAARAGQHGKGFAVVAEEVSTLAAKSASAAKETTDMIENSIKKVETGTKIAHETGGALNQIVEEVDKAADLVDMITVASNDQASSIQQINLGVSQVSQVIQTNVATAEERAAASEELSAQAEQLKQAISVFRIKGDRTRLIESE